MDINRRNFLHIAGTAYLSAGLPFSAAALAAPGSRVSFPQGVASGDPQPDSVMLWTRAQPEAGSIGDVQLILQISASEDFQRVVVEEKLDATAANDYTARALVDGLAPARHYYYRFLASDGGSSRTGRTMTAPEADSDTAFRLAFASCQNYEQGYFGAWARMISEDRLRTNEEQIQFVLHLGDFIYERYRNNDGEGQRFVRSLPTLPDGASDEGLVWADSLADYRHLYKSHLDDPHLQAARARWPFICTWDDHEFSNDNFQYFSTYGEQPKAELQRRRNAHQAWFEYIPALVPESEDLRIYRKLRWGKHADILLTDLRTYRSEAPVPEGLGESLGMPVDAVELVEILDAGRNYNNGAPPPFLPFGNGATPNPARDRDSGSMMGAEQKRWFKDNLAESNATWKLWGNSLPILPLRLDLSALPFQGMQDGILSQDAWSGYPSEYRELMSFVVDSEITGMVSLSGDHHMHGAGTLALNQDDEDAPMVAVDFNVSGISSTPHFDSVLHSAESDNNGFRQLVWAESNGEVLETWNMTLTQGVLAALAYDKSGMTSLAEWLGPNSANRGLVYADTDSNGYGLAKFGADRCSVELVTINPPLEAAGESGDPVLRRARFELPLWKAGEDIALEGPSFEGKPPFPW
jgi:alkaline phosphatase D